MAGCGRRAVIELASPDSGTLHRVVTIDPSKRLGPLRSTSVCQYVCEEFLQFYACTEVLQSNALNRRGMTRSTRGQEVARDRHDFESAIRGACGLPDQSRQSSSFTSISQRHVPDEDMSMYTTEASHPMLSELTERLVMMATTRASPKKAPAARKYVPTKASVRDPDDFSGALRQPQYHTEEQHVGEYAGSAAASSERNTEAKGTEALREDIKRPERSKSTGTERNTAAQANEGPRLEQNGTEKKNGTEVAGTARKAPLKRPAETRSSILRRQRDLVAKESPTQKMVKASPPAASQKPRVPEARIDLPKTRKPVVPVQAPKPRAAPTKPVPRLTKKMPDHMVPKKETKLQKDRRMAQEAAAQRLMQGKSADGSGWEDGYRWVGTAKMESGAYDDDGQAMTINEISSVPEEGYSSDGAAHLTESNQVVSDEVAEAMAAAGFAGTDPVDAASRQEEHYDAWDSSSAGESDGDVSDEDDDVGAPVVLQDSSRVSTESRSSGNRPKWYKTRYCIEIDVPGISMKSSSQYYEVKVLVGRKMVLMCYTCGASSPSHTAETVEVAHKTSDEESLAARIRCEVKPCDQPTSMNGEGDNRTNPFEGLTVSDLASSGGSGACEVECMVASSATNARLDTHVCQEGEYPFLNHRGRALGKIHLRIKSCVVVQESKVIGRLRYKLSKYFGRFDYWDKRVDEKKTQRMEPFKKRALFALAPPPNSECMSPLEESDISSDDDDFVPMSSELVYTRVERPIEEVPPKGTIEAWSANNMPHSLQFVDNDTSRKEAAFLVETASLSKAPERVGQQQYNESHESHERYVKPAARHSGGERSGFIMKRPLASSPDTKLKKREVSMLSEISNQSGPEETQIKIGEAIEPSPFEKIEKDVEYLLKNPNARVPGKRFITTNEFKEATYPKKPENYDRLNVVSKDSHSQLVSGAVASERRQDANLRNGSSEHQRPPQRSNIVSEADSTILDQVAKSRKLSVDGEVFPIPRAPRMPKAVKTRTISIADSVATYAGPNAQIGLIKNSIPDTAKRARQLKEQAARRVLESYEGPLGPRASDVIKLLKPVDDLALARDRARAFLRLMAVVIGKYPLRRDVEFCMGVLKKISGAPAPERIPTDLREYSEGITALCKAFGNGYHDFFEDLLLMMCPPVIDDSLSFGGTSVAGSMVEPFDLRAVDSLQKPVFHEVDSPSPCPDDQEKPYLTPVQSEGTGKSSNSRTNSSSGYLEKDEAKGTRHDSGRLYEKVSHSVVEERVEERVEEEVDYGSPRLWRKKGPSPYLEEPKEEVIESRRAPPTSQAPSDEDSENSGKQSPARDPTIGAENTSDTHPLLDQRSGSGNAEEKHDSTKETPSSSNTKPLAATDTDKKKPDSEGTKPTDQVSGHVSMDSLPPGQKNYVSFVLQKLPKVNARICDAVRLVMQLDPVMVSSPDSEYSARCSALITMADVNADIRNLTTAVSVLIIPLLTEPVQPSQKEKLLLSRLAWRIVGEDVGDSCTVGEFRTKAWAVIESHGLGSNLTTGHCYDYINAITNYLQEFGRIAEEELVSYERTVISGSPVAVHKVLASKSKRVEVEKRNRKEEPVDLKFLSSQQRKSSSASVVSRMDYLGAELRGTVSLLALGCLTEVLDMIIPALDDEVARKITHLLNRICISPQEQPMCNVLQWDKGGASGLFMCPIAAAVFRDIEKEISALIPRNMSEMLHDTIDTIPVVDSDPESGLPFLGTLAGVLDFTAAKTLQSVFLMILEGMKAEDMGPLCKTIADVFVSDVSTATDLISLIEESGASTSMSGGTMDAEASTKLTIGFSLISQGLDDPVSSRIQSILSSTQTLDATLSRAYIEGMRSSPWMAKLKDRIVAIFFGSGVKWPNHALVKKLGRMQLTQAEVAVLEAVLPLQLRMDHVAVAAYDQAVRRAVSQSLMQDGNKIMSSVHRLCGGATVHRSVDSALSAIIPSLTEKGRGNKAAVKITQAIMELSKGGLGAMDGEDDKSQDLVIDDSDFDFFTCTIYNPIVSPSSLSHFRQMTQLASAYMTADQMKKYVWEPLAEVNVVVGEGVGLGNAAWNYEGKVHSNKGGEESMMSPITDRIIRRVIENVEDHLEIANGGDGSVTENMRQAVAGISRVPDVAFLSFMPGGTAGRSAKEAMVTMVREVLNPVLTEDGMRRAMMAVTSIVTMDTDDDLVLKPVDFAIDGAALYKLLVLVRAVQSMGNLATILKMERSLVGLAVRGMVTCEGIEVPIGRILFPQSPADMAHATVHAAGAMCSVLTSENAQDAAVMMMSLSSPKHVVVSDSGSDV